MAWNPLSTRRITLAAATAALLGSTVFLAPAASGLSARSAPAGSGKQHTPQVVATGLDNPRLLSFSSSGDLFVAESGKGGAGPCMAAPEGEACFGMSGAVTRIRHGKQSRVLTGLPSMAGANGGGASGPADVIVDGRDYAVLLGLGNDPAARDKLPASGKLLGTVATGRFGRGAPRAIADLVAYEARVNPDGGGKDTNPTGLERGRRGGYFVADAGANALLAVDRGRSKRSRGYSVSTVTTFPKREVDAPPIPNMPPKLAMESVPTSVATGPDGAAYVSELTGFPFPKSGATVWRVDRHGTRTVYATGLTNVTDLAWYRGKLYAVQLADNGMLAVSPGQLPQGSLVQVSKSGMHKVVAKGLNAPYGVAFRRGSAYLTTCAMCAGQGAVVTVAVR
ncbi:MAG: ScyD/ScyE family protein [Dermatophilus congolensis]|nr:ScyD/ScyE family protein [Dermatophilus congolensis]